MIGYVDSMYPLYDMIKMHFSSVVFLPKVDIQV